MPELPEVETMRRGILGIVGARVVDVERTPCRSKPIAIAPRIDRFRRRVQHRFIRDVARAGKRVVVWLDSSDAIVLEPRMSGLVLVADPPSLTHLRWRLKLTNTSVHELLYWDRRGLGSVRLFSATEFAAGLGDGQLGPDALTVTPELLRERLGRSRRAIKVALLDQRALAGIGNLYASEILHVAGVHPERSCRHITASQWQALCQVMHDVLQSAIRHEGSTLGDGTYRNALNKAGGYQSHHRVYARQGQPCTTCGRGTIRRIVQAQRSTFFCPNCQRRSRHVGRPASDALAGTHRLCT